MSRCFGDGDPLYADYHDTEWGVPPADFGAHEAELFERLILEVFQVGLSWLLILRRREAFRAAFAGFDPVRIAKFTASDVDALSENPGIIRNRAKISATIRNARALLDMHARGESLAALLARHRPAQVITRRDRFEDVPGFTEESAALAKALKAQGFTFVGPTNAYAMMQALGIVDDHLAGCPAASDAGSARPRDIWDEVSDRTAE